MQQLPYRQEMSDMCKFLNMLNKLDSINDEHNGATLPSPRGAKANRKYIPISSPQNSVGHANSSPSKKGGKKQRTGVLAALSCVSRRQCRAIPKRLLMLFTTRRIVRTRGVSLWAYIHPYHRCAARRASFTSIPASFLSKKRFI